MLYIEKDKMFLVFIDNIFLRGMMDLDFESWWYMLKDIYSRYFICRENEFGLNCFCIIMIIGINVIEKVCDFMGKFIFILEEKLLINFNCFKGNEMDVIFLK